jgi:hypothetical protein
LRTRDKCIGERPGAAAVLQGQPSESVDVVEIAVLEPMSTSQASCVTILRSM